MNTARIVLLLALITAISGLALAQEAEETQQPMTEHRMMGKSMTGKGMMAAMPTGKMKAGMHGMMMKKMMEKQIVATSDGGAIVMTCNKLLKYDSQLNLVNEVEIKTDFDYLGKMMQEMKEKCAMHQNMMQADAQQTPEDSAEDIPDDASEEAFE